MGPQRNLHNKDRLRFDSLFWLTSNALHASIEQYFTIENLCSSFRNYNEKTLGGLSSFQNFDPTEKTGKDTSRYEKHLNPKYLWTWTDHCQISLKRQF